MVIAREKGLSELKHHILPRTKGFAVLMKGIHKHSELKFGLSMKIFLVFSYCSL
jgi:hypothetical protein